MSGQLNYVGPAVNYEELDPFKIATQEAARSTAGNIRRLGLSEVPESRGESVYLIRHPDHYEAHVEEGLGTKNLVADAVGARIDDWHYYHHIGQDTVAMIVNDMVTLGALPVSVAMHLAVGSADWFKNQPRWRFLVDGWKYACDLAGCVWGPGETPALKDNVTPEGAVISGSAVGIVKPLSRLISGNIHDGDAIVLLKSSGIHANGLTDAREIAARLPAGYLTRLTDNRTYGETLLDPTIIYVRLIEECLRAGLDIHYTVNITGHGWRKLMRSPLPFTYVIEHVPKSLPIFDFLKAHSGRRDRAMYEYFNMGAGFAIMLPRREAAEVSHIAAQLNAEGHNYGPILAGYVKASRRRRVEIRPKYIVFDEEDLQIR